MPAAWRVEKDQVIGTTRRVVARLRSSSGRERPNPVALAFAADATTAQIEATLTELARRWERHVARTEPQQVPRDTWEVRARDAANVVASAVAAPDLHPEDAEP